MTFDDDGYWLECIRRSKSNSVVSGWMDIVDYACSGQADDRTLRGLRCALRDLAQKCSDEINQRREDAKLSSR